MADPAKTAKKSTALPPRIVPKTSRYPMAENQAQSTRKSLVRPSTMKQATMTMTATAMPLLGIIPPPFCVRHLHGPVTGSDLGLAAGGKETPTVRPPDRQPRPQWAAWGAALTATRSAPILSDSSQMKKPNPHIRGRTGRLGIAVDHFPSPDAPPPRQARGACCRLWLAPE